MAGNETNLERIRDEISDKINVREFLSQWDDDVYKLCATTVPDFTEAIASTMNMTTDNVQELESVCSLDKLKVSEHIHADRWSLLEDIPQDLDLMCVRFQKQELERRRTNRQHKVNVQRKFKYKKDDQNLMYHPTIDHKLFIPDECRVIYPDVLLQVHVHRPMKTKRKRKGTLDDGRYEQLIPTACLLVLGRQKLVTLRDAIRCTYDYTVSGDLSVNPDACSINPAKDIFKSGLFYIEGTFYNDMREADARDYSKVITDWAKDRNLGPYKSDKMEDVTFLDLTLRLGEPYLYLHQGDCEHLIIFSDIRLLTAVDPQDVRDYPFLLRKHRRLRTLCRVCSAQTARWVTYGSKTAPENPCFFCDQCFRFLHYDQDNKKIGEFEAYKYFDHHAII